MKTIQMTIDEPLLKRLDEAAGCGGVARSALIRTAIEHLLEELELEELNRRDAAAYAAVPDSPAELAPWLKAQAWEEDDGW